jgi:cold shock CspA family protein
MKMATESETGTVKKWIAPRSFGFLKPDLGGVDLFFHLDAFVSDAEPQEGDRVSYEIAADASGRQRAVNVRLV